MKDKNMYFIRMVILFLLCFLFKSYLIIKINKTCYIIYMKEIPIVHNFILTYENENLNFKQKDFFI